MKSLVGKIGSLWSTKDLSTGERFVSGLKDSKSIKVSMLKTTLQKALTGFDFLTKKTALLVYFQADDGIQLLFELKFLQNMGEQIEKDFAFIGVNVGSSELGLIHKHLKTGKDSEVVCLAFNDFGELEKCNSMEVSHDTLLNRPLMLEFLRSSAEKAQKFQGSFEQSIKSLHRKTTSNQLNPDFGGDHGFDYDDEVAPTPPDMRKQFSADRHMKNDQDRAYEEAIRKIQREQEKVKEDDMKRQKEAMELAAKEQAMKQSAQMYEQEVVSLEFAIQLLFRLPNGKKVQRTFDRRSKIEYVKGFVNCIEDKGLENQKADFELMSGYPPAVLALNKTLLEVFGGSENEMIQVREV